MFSFNSLTELVAVAYPVSPTSASHSICQSWREQQVGLVYFTRLLVIYFSLPYSNMTPSVTVVGAKKQEAKCLQMNRFKIFLKPVIASYCWSFSLEHRCKCKALWMPIKENLVTLPRKKTQQETAVFLLKRKNTKDGDTASYWDLNHSLRNENVPKVSEHRGNITAGVKISTSDWLSHAHSN